MKSSQPCVRSLSIWMNICSSHHILLAITVHKENTQGLRVKNWNNSLSCINKAIKHCRQKKCVEIWRKWLLFIYSFIFQKMCKFGTWTCISKHGPVQLTCIVFYPLFPALPYWCLYGRAGKFGLGLSQKHTSIWLADWMHCKKHLKTLHIALLAN